MFGASDVGCIVTVTTHAPITPNIWYGSSREIVGVYVQY